jgi:hypothetical protein
MELRRWLVGCFYDYRAGAVAEDDAGCAVGVVDDRRHYVRADDHHFLVRSGLHELRAYLQGVDELRATGG